MVTVKGELVYRDGMGVEHTQEVYYTNDTIREIMQVEVDDLHSKICEDFGAFTNALIRHALGQESCRVVGINLRLEAVEVPVFPGQGPA